MNVKTQISRLLRKEQTKAEAKLWKYLRNRRFENLKFRRQHPLKKYIVDFINIDNRLIIELDGEYHNDILQQEKDQLRDLHLEALGYSVLRFENEVVFENLKIIFDSIKKSVNKGTPKKTDGKNPLTLALSPRRGNKSTTILSTKKLTTAQKELLLNSGIGFIAYDAINIELLHVDVQDEIQNMIFTSKNAVKAVLNSEINVSNCFCVGENTKRLLEENGKKVIKTALNASDLANFIVKKHKNESFLFFCGNLRRKELPELLKDQKVALKEQIVYKTSLNSKKFNRSFDGILFFSPSGIQSYIKENTIGRSIVFCIGNTTASEAKKYTEHVVIANKPTVENVIVQAVKYFNQDLSSQT
ncbi:DUF559 domain-containing protein [Aquimarina celericrescens]|uniref:DUF559 domain-containing protein n=1 Tax=Aquimarina celericrescens TaxID=1964542 RepID=A0ABW5AV45_9FLAO